MKDKDILFRQRFAVPLINKNAGTYNPSRPAPTLGMRARATFVAKPLHDPSGEFAIVLYDPTINDPATITKEKASNVDSTDSEVEKPKSDVPIMHRSLADILGLKKQVDDHPKIPVVIDPKLAKVLRPHQIEGVKVYKHPRRITFSRLILVISSFCINAQLDSLILKQTAASWQTKWVWAKL